MRSNGHVIIARNFLGSVVVRVGEDGHSVNDQLNF